MLFMCETTKCLNELPCIPMHLEKNPGSYNYLKHNSNTVSFKPRLFLCILSPIRFNTMVASRATISSIVGSLGHFERSLWNWPLILCMGNQISNDKNPHENINLLTQAIIALYSYTLQYKNRAGILRFIQKLNPT